MVVRAGGFIGSETNVVSPRTGYARRNFYVLTRAPSPHDRSCA